MKGIFNNNLKKLRIDAGWTQERACMEIGVGRPLYGAWEEGRSFPNQEALVKIAQVFGIIDLISLIENEHFTREAQYPSAWPAGKGDDELRRRYRLADTKVRLAVNILLGIVDVDN